MATVREFGDNRFQHGEIVRSCSSGPNTRRCVIGQRSELTRLTEQGDQIVITGEKNSEVASARRRLIRGTFAAPAVLALHSGSAIAAASGLNCVRAQVANPVYPGYSAAPDIYVRVQLYALYETTAGTLPIVGWYLSGSSVEAARFGYRKVVNSFLSAGNWRKVVLNAAGGTVQLDATVLTAPPAGPERFALGPTWVALKVDPSDTRGEVEIVGVVDGFQAPGSSAVTGSCWTSFTGFLGTA